MSQTVDVVVIGAGINGASIAYNLAKMGCRKVVVVEKHIIASGGTGKSAALVRQHYSNEVLVKMVKRCRDIFEHFSEMVGGSSGFVKTGYMFLVPESVVDKFRANVVMQQRLGVNTRCISKEDVRSLAPRMDVEDAAGIAYEPDSGYADPYDSTVSYLHRARELGARVYQNCPVHSIRTSNGKVQTVVTAKEEFSTRVAVNVTGPWANLIGKMVNIKYPIQVTREQEVLFRAKVATDSPAITVSDMCNAIYFHPFGRDLLVGRGFPKDYQEVDPDQYAEGVDQSFIEEIAERLTKRVPSMMDSLCLRGYSGLYDVTPDWHPIIGQHREVEGFVSCVGFSGHGFKLGPVVGEAVAELILEGRAKGIDLGVFSPYRFETGNPFKAAYGGNRG